MTEPEPRLVTAEEAVIYLRDYLGVHVKEVTVRQWVHRGYVQSLKNLRRPRARYNLDDIDGHARKTLLADSGDLL